MGFHGLLFDPFPDGGIGVLREQRRQIAKIAFVISPQICHIGLGLRHRIPLRGVMHYVNKNDAQNAALHHGGGLEAHLPPQGVTNENHPFQL
jgi:hypothetical protein